MGLPWTSSAATALAIATWTVGCGSHTAQSPPSQAASDSGYPDSSCGNFFDSFIAFSRRCGFDPLPLTPAPTQTSQKGAFNAYYCGDLATAAGASNLGGEIEACTSAIDRATSCVVDSTCSLRGTLATGAACASDVQCASGVCVASVPPVNSDTDGMCGTCAARIGLAGECLSGLGTGRDLCDSGLYCSLPQGASSSYLCTAYLSQNDPCDRLSAPAVLCAPGLICDSQAKTCQPIPTRGQACPNGRCLPPYFCQNDVCRDRLAAGETCSGFGCASGLTCNSHTSSGASDGGPTMNPNVCVPAAAGKVQLCTACRTSACDAIMCDANLTCQGTCVDLPQVQVGAPCHVGQLPSACGPFLVCASGSCIEPDFSRCR